MKNDEKIHSLIVAGKTAYIIDDFYDFAIRIEPTGKTFLKHKGSPEHEVEHSNEIVFDVRNGGEMVTKEKYERF